MHMFLFAESMECIFHVLPTKCQRVPVPMTIKVLS